MSKEVSFTFFSFHFFLFIFFQCPSFFPYRFHTPLGLLARRISTAPKILSIPAVDTGIETGFSSQFSTFLARADAFLKKISTSPEMFSKATKHHPSVLTKNLEGLIPLPPPLWRKCPDLNNCTWREFFCFSFFPSIALVKYQQHKMGSRSTEWTFQTHLASWNAWTGSVPLLAVSSLYARELPLAPWASSLYPENWFWPYKCSS